MIADRLQDLFELACCDGFILCPSLSPAGYEEFCQSVVPELQRRGIFKNGIRWADLPQPLARSLTPCGLLPVWPAI